jgi:hypothetical protein
VWNCARSTINSDVHLKQAGEAEESRAPHISASSLGFQVGGSACAWACCVPTAAAATPAPAACPMQRFKGVAEELQVFECKVTASK